MNLNIRKAFYTSPTSKLSNTHSYFALISIDKEYLLNQDRAGNVLTCSNERKCAVMKGCFYSDEYRVRVKKSWKRHVFSGDD